MPIINVDLESGSELQEIADAIGRSRKVVVLTGAGISTNCGIPDFRSKDGLYSLIQNQYETALKDPPWEQSNTFDISNRPKKKRKKWYYEVVAPDGLVVDVIDDDLPKGQSRTSNFYRSTCNGSIDILQQKINSQSLPTSPTQRFNSPIIQSGESYKIQELSIEKTSDQDQDQDPVKSLYSHSESKGSQICNNSLEATDNGSLFYSHGVTSSTGSLKKNILMYHSNLDISQKTSNRPMKLASPVKNTLREETNLEEPSGYHENTSSLEQPLTQQNKRIIPNLKGRDLFDAMIWSDPVKTSIFYMFMTSFRKKVQLVKSTSEAHRFFKVLRDSGRLVRTYTQNIDCLEEKEGLLTDLTLGPGNRARFQSRNQKSTPVNESIINSNKFRGVEAVLLHGSLGSLRCEVCSQLCDWDKDDRIAITSRGTAPECPHCAANNSKRRGGGRRALTVGRLRPDIVLYGEEHPNSSLISPLITHDLKLGPDMLLVMGTSLKVHGLKIMIKEFAKAVHSRGGKVVFVNQTRPSESIWSGFIDYWVGWDCDKWVMDLKERNKELWMPQGASGKNLTKRKLGTPSNLQEVKRVKLRDTYDDKSCAAYCVSKIMSSLAQKDSGPLHEVTNKFKRRSFKSYTKKSTARVKKVTNKLLPKALKDCFSANSPRVNSTDGESPSNNIEKQKIDSNNLTSFFSKGWLKCWADFGKDDNHLKSNIF
ncbi:putative hst3 protein [Erysiphe neolycopersici]|uniref:Putative hst3 protein n=1 Tax=Erysiphe neolycopersici TaxID=212602 RepID=A0A420HQZ0_9PEZI|nr:putative hst3 protein [Erysiphe neolycopersici]